MAEIPYKPRKTKMTPEEIKKAQSKKPVQNKGNQKQGAYYKPRKTLMSPAEIKNAQTKNPQAKPTQAKNPKAQNKITKTPPVKQKTEEKPKNVAGGYSKRITYPKEELKPTEVKTTEKTKGIGGIQKGGGKIGGYVKPKTVSYSRTPMKKIIWALLVLFLIAIVFMVLYFTNTLNNLEIGGIGLKSQDLEMRISNAQIENDSIDLKLDIKPHGEDLVGVKIIVDDGVNFDVFKVELTKEEIEKGEIHLDLDQVDGDRVNKILISPITNTKEREGVVGSVEESYVPKKTDFVSQRDLNNYNEPDDVYYPYDWEPGKDDNSNSESNNGTNQNLDNQTNLNQTQTNETINQTEQENNETQTNETENTTDDSDCTKDTYTLCYHDAVFEYNKCTSRWVLKQECSSEEVCIDGACIHESDVAPQCGNGVLEVGEHCDLNNLAGETCESFGYISGTLICNANCAFDLRNCIDPNTEPGCTPNQTYSCYQENVYWYDSCDELGMIKEECENGCQNNACILNACDPLPNACDGKECGSDGCSDNGCGTCSSTETCENGLCVSTSTNYPCWFIEENECIAGDDEATCNKDVIYSSAQECEDNLIPATCYPLETVEYHCTPIEETSPGYDSIVQGEDTCGPCPDTNSGQVIQQGDNYYCKCLTTLGIK